MSPMAPSFLLVGSLRDVGRVGKIQDLMTDPESGEVIPPSEPRVSDS